MAETTAQRMTRQRQVILEELQKVRTHPTAAELHRRIRRRLPRISLATVYRNLERLAAEGTIRKLTMCGDQRRFDACMEEHHHVRCERCGRVQDISIEGVDLLQRAARRARDFKLTGFRLEFSGLCERCRKRRSSS